MAGLIIALSLVSCFTAGMFVFIAKRYLKWMEIAVKYQRELLETRRMLESVSLDLKIERARKSLVVHVRESRGHMFDEQTKALIRLAVSNPEKLEGESAAMIVCKRLKEKIDG